MDTRDNEGWIALMFAVDEKNINTARLLLNANSNVTIRCETGWSALMIASHRNSFEIVALLLSTTADINDVFESTKNVQNMLSQKPIQHIIESRLDELSPNNLIKWKNTVLRKFLRKGSLLLPFLYYNKRKTYGNGLL